MPSAPNMHGQTTAGISHKTGKSRIPSEMDFIFSAAGLCTASQKTSREPSRVTHKTEETAALWFQQGLLLNYYLHITNVIWKSHQSLWPVWYQFNFRRLWFHTNLVLVLPPGTENMYFLCLAAPLLAFLFKNILFSAFIATKGGAISI